MNENERVDPDAVTETPPADALPPEAPSVITEPPSSSEPDVVPAEGIAVTDPPVDGPNRAEPPPEYITKSVFLQFAKELREKFFALDARDERAELAVGKHAHRMDAVDDQLRQARADIRSARGAFDGWDARLRQLDARLQQAQQHMAESRAAFDRRPKSP